MERARATLFRHCRSLEDCNHGRTRNMQDIRLTEVDISGNLNAGPEPIMRSIDLDIDGATIVNDAGFEKGLSGMTHLGIHKSALLVLLFVGAVLPTKQACSAGWELVFSDEFNGDKLDRTKW